MGWSAPVVELLVVVGWKLLSLIDWDRSNTAFSQTDHESNFIIWLIYSKLIWKRIDKLSLRTEREQEGLVVDVLVVSFLIFGVCLSVCLCFLKVWRFFSFLRLFFFTFVFIWFRFFSTLISHRPGICQFFHYDTAFNGFLTDHCRPEKWITVSHHQVYTRSTVI